MITGASHTWQSRTSSTLPGVRRLCNCLFAKGRLKESEMYDVDFDHQFMETGKYGARPIYKKFPEYRPGMAATGELIVGKGAHLR